MKLFNKTAIALTLSLLGSVCSVSALAMATNSDKFEEVIVKVEKDLDRKMNVFVNVDGEVTNVDVSPSAMKNPVELDKLLANVPEEIRKKLIADLNSENLHEGNVKVIIDHDTDKEVIWISEGDDIEEHHIEVLSEDGHKKVMIMELDGDISENHEIHSVVQKMIDPSNLKTMQFIHKGTMTAESIVGMVERGNFTAEELDKIQQALDVKR